MGNQSTAVVEIDSIEIEEGHNPRSAFDEAAMSELEASIRASGLVTALTVRPNGNEGSYLLIAGERRLIAAKRAGLKSVPVVIREQGDPLAAAIAENLIRADLDPIEEARALARLGEAEQLSTHKELARRVGKSSAFVSARLRLLKLPEAVQSAIAKGDVPVAAEPDLRKVAKVSPEVATCACVLASEGEIDGRDLLDRFDEVLCAVAESERPGMSTMIDVARSVWLSDVVTDPEAHADQAERWRAVRPYEKADDPTLRFGEAEIDAARAAGKLLESEVDHGGWASRASYVCDAELAADLAERVLERSEKEVVRRTKESAAARGEGDNEVSPEDAAERLREERRSERAKAKREAEKARSFNLDLGRALVARRGAASRKEHSLGRARALAEVVLADNPNLAARGLRLVLPQLQDVEVKQLKSGESREIVTYRDAADCEQYLRKRIAEAKSANEILELLGDALIAAMNADQRELAQSRQVHWWTPAQDRVRKLLAPDARSVRPRRRKAGRD
jgi:ParB/RepB/Spo0J family partition protein